MKVKDEYRKNKLSFKPGGYTVIVKYMDKYKEIKSLEYNKVKYPKSYVRQIIVGNKNLEEIQVIDPETNEVVDLYKNFIN